MQKSGGRPLFGFVVDVGTCENYFSIFKPCRQGSGRSGTAIQSRLIKLKHSSLPEKIWSVSGLTEHLGGVNATRQLLLFLPHQPGSVILDIGCGTGFTSCQLAGQGHAIVLAMDLNFGTLLKARDRIEREGFDSSIGLFCADATHLPLAGNSMDGAVSESVLVFTVLSESLDEIHRVLRSEGILADNELTYLENPPIRMENLLAELFGIHTFNRESWEETYRLAGFDQQISKIHKINLLDQAKSHLQVDGLGNYLKAIWVGLSDKMIRKTFFNKDMLAALMHFRKYIGYGLYVVKKR